MKNRKNGLFRSSLFWIVVFLLIMGVIYFISGSNQNNSQIRSIQSSQFMHDLNSNKIKNFSIQPSGGVYKITGDYRKAQPNRSHSSYSFAGLGSSKSSHVKKFDTTTLKNDSTVKTISRAAKADHVKMGAKPEKSNGIWFNLLVSVLPLIIIFVFFFYMMNKAGRGAGGGIMRINKSKVKPVKHSKTRFSDVAGEDAEKQELVEVVEFLKNPKKYSRLGATIPHGVLLEGPPGTGKTLLAKAVAGEAHVPFYSVSGSDFVQMFVGVGASRVRSLFSQAKKHAPAIIFIDEIDAVGRKRGSGVGGGHDEREQTLNQLLVEMDGFTGNEGVIVIAATNRADVLDPALTRPGRFDRKVLVGRPDVRGREAILKVHAKNKPFADNVDMKEIARQTPGFVGADLANLLYDAALLAARRNHNRIEPHDLDNAEDRVIAGPAKKNAVINPREENIVAAHEAGHTIVGLVLNDARVVHKVTIVPRGRAGGYAIMLPKEDQKLLSKHDAMEQLAGLLGGRTAEEIIFHSKSSGASNDFQQATNLARVMVTQYGMSDKLGDVQLEDPTQGPYARPRYSEHTATLIDQEVKRFIDHAHQEAYRIIQSHRPQHKVIMQALLKYETLNAKQIKSLYETGHMPEKSQTEFPSEHASYQESKQALEKRDSNGASNSASSASAGRSASDDQQSSSSKK